MITYEIPFNSKLVWHETNGFHVYGTDFIRVNNFPFIHHCRYHTLEQTQERLFVECMEESKYRFVNNTYVDRDTTDLFGYDYIIKLGHHQVSIECCELSKIHSVDQKLSNRHPMHKYAFNVANENYRCFPATYSKFDCSNNYFVFTEGDLAFNDGKYFNEYILYVNKRKLPFTECCRDAKISPDEKFIAVAVGNTVKYFDPNTLRIITEFDFNERIQHLAFSADGLTLGVLGVNKLYVMDVE